MNYRLRQERAQLTRHEMQKQVTRGLWGLALKCVLEELRSMVETVLSDENRDNVTHNAIKNSF